MLYAAIGKKEVDYSSLELGFFKLRGSNGGKKGMSVHFAGVRAVPLAVF